MLESTDPWVMKCDMCEVRYPHLHIRPMEEVLDYYSCDAEAFGGTTARDCLEGKLRDTEQINALVELIERDGYRPGYGVAVEEKGWYDGPYVHDGHHRLTVMYYMGAQWCPVQRKPSHANDTREYAEAKRALWEKRRAARGLRILVSP